MTGVKRVRLRDKIDQAPLLLTFSARGRGSLGTRLQLAYNCETVLASCHMHVTRYGSGAITLHNSMYSRHRGLGHQAYCSGRGCSPGGRQSRTYIRLGSCQLEAHSRLCSSPQMSLDLWKVQTMSYAGFLGLLAWSCAMLHMQAVLDRDYSTIFDCITAFKVLISELLL